MQQPRHPGATNQPHLPNAPTQPRRDRSRSPRRSDTANGNQQYREQSPTPPRQQEHFLDPFQEIDKHQGRIINGGEAFQGVECAQLQPLERTSAGEAFKTFVHEMAKAKIRPKDIPGKWTQQLPLHEVKMAVDNMRLYLAHLDSMVYKEKFQNEKWCQPLGNLNADLVPGAVVTARIAEPLINRSVPVDDPSRSSHENGPLSDKIRTVVILNSDDADFEVSETTAFGDSSTYPRHKMGEYCRLARVNDTSDDRNIPDYVHTIRYEGNNHLTEPSFFRFTRPRWISLKNARVAVEGQIVLEDLSRLAHIADFKQGHPLDRQANIRRRKRAEEERRVREEAEEARGYGYGIRRRFGL